jgi:DNA-binding XRE family transcriptional regulator
MDPKLPPPPSKRLEARTESKHPEARAVLTALGARLQRARVRRDITLREMAKRMGVEARTLSRLESGAPGVALETMALVLWHMNLLEQLDGICAPGTDPEGERLAEVRSPKRARGERAAGGAWDTLQKL